MPGKIPKEIKILTRVEVGMVGLCNPVMSMSVMHGSGQAYLKRYNCTLVKDVNEVARQLPRHMSLSDLAVLRPEGCTQQPNDLRFRPAVVLNALRWLQQNNPLYAHVVLDENVFDDPLSVEYSDVEELPFNAEETVELDDALRTVGASVSTNPTTNTSFTETLLLRPPDATSTEQHLQESLVSDDIVREWRGIQPGSQTVVALPRSSTFANPVTHPHYFELCFPNLFPYGRGGPGDLNVLSDVEHARTMLTRGGVYGETYRWYQMYSPYYFTLYAHLMRRKVGGLVATIVKNATTSGHHPTNLRGRNEYAEGEDEDDEGRGLDDDDGADSDNEGGVSYAVHDAELTVANVLAVEAHMRESRNSMRNETVKKLMDRLTPYAQSLPGTVPHIKCERRKLLAMVASHVVSLAGRMVWFVTMTNPAPYSDDLFNILTGTNAPLHFASSDDDVQDITRKVDELDRTSRARLLGEHPALALRLSKLKVDAVWRLLITDGLAQPLGRVSDLWYRTEFQARLIDHIHAMVAVARKQLEDSLHANKSPLPDIVDTQVIACQPVAICVHIMVLFGRMLCGNT